MLQNGSKVSHICFVRVDNTQFFFCDAKDINHSVFYSKIK